jgi:acid phosphatase type 7
MKRLVVSSAVVLAAAVTAAGANSVASSTSSFRAVADTYVSAAQKGKNFGRARTVVVGTRPRSAAYVRFDLRGVDATVGRAKLRLYVRSATRAGLVVSQASPDDWGESAVTFTSRPATGSRVATVGRRLRRGWLTINVTGLARRTYVVDLALTALRGGRVSIASREDGRHAPRLVATLAHVSPQTLVAAGDIASCASAGDEQTAALVAQIPGTVAALGDNAYETGSAAEYANCYGPSWGRFKARTKPVPGNHEYETPGATGYYGYFGALAGDPAKGYYSYDLGRWHVVALNSNCAAIGGCNAGSPQEQWLRADLAAHPAFCTLAYWHHPRWSSGQVGDDSMTAGLWAALQDGGADLVLVGHDHDYERFAPLLPDRTASPTRGIREFVVGTGGRSHFLFTHVTPNSQTRNDNTFGVLKLTLHAARYDWQFVPVAGQTFTDAGSGLCH